MAKPISKEDIRKIMELWPDAPTSVIAAELGIKPQAVSYVVKKVREAGVPLKKSSKVRTVPSLIREILREDSH